LKSPRPSILIWLSVFFILPGFTYLQRFVQSLQPLPLDPGIPSWYLPVFGLLWGIAFLSAAVLLWFRRSWVPRFLKWMGAVYLVFLWGERLLTRSDYAAQSTPFVVVLSVVLYGLMWILLSMQRVRSFFFQQ
jgi:hypothetical protein